MTTKELLFDWLELYEKERIKARTYGRYRELIDIHIVPCMGDREISGLGRREIQAFLLQRKKKGNARSGGELSATSINLMLTVLNLALQYACDMEYLDENPCLRVRRIKDVPKKAEAFSKEEQRAIEREIAASADGRLQGILLCLYTGLRIGELLGLTWEDVDLEQGIVKVSKTVYRGKDENGNWQLCVDTPKSKSSERVIPLPPYMINLLKSARTGAKSPYVVENKKGERMSIRSYQYLFERLTQRAGVRKLNFHALRHTFATRAIECGMDVKTVAEIMGHQNASVTLNRYAHCMLDHKIQMMQRLPRVL